MKIELSYPLNSEEICTATGASYCGKKRTFTHIATASYETDDKTLFFALEGKHTSGEEYVYNLAGRNICSVSQKHGKNIFTHDDAKEALLALAKYYKRKYFSSIQKTIAITGSVGKTTTKEYLLRILSICRNTYANEGNLNSDIGVPLTIFSIPKGCEYLILEFGMNHRGEIRKLASSSEPDLALITNIGHAHIGNLLSRQEIAKEKMDVVSHNDTIPVFIKKGEPLLLPLKNKIIIGEDISFWEETEDGITYLHLNTQKRKTRVYLPLLPEDMKSCLRDALCIGLYLGLKEDELTAGALSCEEYRGRRQHLSLGGATIIDDTYNASPESMRCGLSYFMQVKGRKYHAVLGDMLELGEHSVPLHYELGRYLCTLCPDYVYLYGEFCENTHEGLRDGGYNGEVCTFHDRENYEGLLRVLSNQIESGDVVYLKGSHGVRLWRVIEGLKEIYI